MCERRGEMKGGREKERKSGRELQSLLDWQSLYKLKE